MVKFEDIKSKLLEERLPAAYDAALLVMNKAEFIIYMAIIKSLEEFSDVSIEIDEDDDVCSFFNIWNQEGNIKGALSYKKHEDGNYQLSCEFDLYKIRDTFETLSTDLFGTLPGDYSQKLDDSEKLPFNTFDVGKIENGFQKVNLPRKNSNN